jgi:hypothetical protein
VDTDLFRHPFQDWVSLTRATHVSHGHLRTLKTNKIGIVENVMTSTSGTNPSAEGAARVCRSPQLAMRIHLLTSPFSEQGCGAIVVRDAKITSTSATVIWDTGLQ